MAGRPDEKDGERQAESLGEEAAKYTILKTTRKTIDAVVKCQRRELNPYPL